VNIGSKSAISLQWGLVDPKFQVKVVAPTNHSSSQKKWLNDLSYSIKIWAELFLFVTIHAFDRQMDRQLSPDCTALHSMQCSKKTLEIVAAREST